MRWRLAAALLIVVGLAGCGAGGAAGRPAAPAAVPMPQRLTPGDTGQAFVIGGGGTFLLDLGDGSWTVQVGHPGVIARVPNVMVIRGAQGMYRAVAPGATSLTATAPGTPRFQVQIDVRAKAPAGAAAS